MCEKLALEPAAAVGDPPTQTPSGIVAAIPHQNGKAMSANKPRTVHMVQNIFRSIRLF